MLRPSPNHGTQRLPNDDEMKNITIITYSLNTRSLNNQGCFNPVTELDKFISGNHDAANQCVVIKDILQPRLSIDHECFLGTHLNANAFVSWHKPN